MVDLLNEDIMREATKVSDSMNISSLIRSRTAVIKNCKNEKKKKQTEVVHR